MDYTWDEFHSSLLGNNIPELLIAAAGIIALLMVIAYVKDKEGFLYKFLVLAGLVAGVLLIIVSIDTYDYWDLSTTIIAIVAGFALIIRPFRDVHFAVILALFVGALVYVLLGDFAGGDLNVIAEGYPRIIIAFVAAALVFMMANFIESVVKFFGKLLNAWPILLLLGLLCIAEGICVYMGYGSVYDMIDQELLKEHMSSLTGE
jgi:hypothetical protein